MFVKIGKGKGSSRPKFFQVCPATFFYSIGLMRGPSVSPLTTKGHGVGCGARCQERSLTWSSAIRIKLKHSSSFGKSLPKP